jgi:hypothetical protein
VTTTATEIPGFMGFAGDLRSRAAAIGEGDIPVAWTPEHVGVRLIEAFEILSRSGTRVGPGRVGNGWPAMVHEFADMVDAQARSLAEKEKQQARAARPTADELSRMNEALGWPMAYLDGKALAADSLMLWAYASATGRDMAGMLNHRRKRAVALAERMAQQRNRLPFGTGPNGEGDTRPLAMQWRAALRHQIVADVAATVPAARAQAELRLRLGAANCMPYRFKPHEAVPGRALARTTLDRYRKVAMAIVAAGLQRARIPVR